MLTISLVCISCASHDSVYPQNITDMNDTAPKGHVQLSIHDNSEFKVLSQKKLDADGKAFGLSAYELIQNFGGIKSIESPDLYSINHTDVKHIYEDSDDVVGHHFVFLAHLDHDRDRDKIKINDRQRNEIKAYDKSTKELKGFKNESMVYQWTFKINDSMEVSKRFSHFFQLKAKGGDDKSPILTITGNERNGNDGLEVRHKGAGKFTVLQRADWTEIAGEWIDVYCRVDYAESGSVRMITKRLSDNKIIFDIDQSDLDMWRGTQSKHFVRPKWGIYRSVADYDNLRSEEEVVRFANFTVSKISY